MVVDIAREGREILEIKSSDDIEELTKKFCEKHKLNERCRETLLATIKQNLFGNAEETFNQIQENQTEEDKADTDSP